MTCGYNFQQAVFLKGLSGKLKPPLFVLSGYLLNKRKHKIKLFLYVYLNYVSGKKALLMFFLNAKYLEDDWIRLPPITLICTVTVADLSLVTLRCADSPNPIKTLVD